MSGSPGEMGNLLAQAQRMQKALDEAREELRTIEVESSLAGGVRAWVNGEGALQRLEISEPAHQARGREELESLICAAVRDAQERAREQAQERLAAVTGGLQLPGFL